MADLSDRITHGDEKALQMFLALEKSGAPNE
jgi:hypothetical protein